MLIEVMSVQASLLEIIDRTAADDEEIYSG